MRPPGVLTRLGTTAPLTFVTAHGATLAHLGQDEWLTFCDPVGYPLVREWAAVIRRWVADADGIAYRRRHDADRTACLLWTDPGAARHPGLKGPGPSLDYLATDRTAAGEFGLYRWNMDHQVSGPDAYFHRTISESSFVPQGTVRLHDGRSARVDAAVRSRSASGVLLRGARRDGNQWRATQ